MLLSKVIWVSSRSNLNSRVNCLFPYCKYDKLVSCTFLSQASFFLLNLCILAYRWPLGRRPRKWESSSFGLMSGAIATFLAASQFLGRCSTACMGKPSLNVSIKGEDKTFSCSERKPVHTSNSFGLIWEAIKKFLAASQFLGRCSTTCSVNVFCSEYMIETIPVS